MVLVLGSRLNIRQSSYNWKDFAKNAVIVSVDIDPHEAKKDLIHIDHKIQMDLRIFLENLIK